MAAQVTDRLGKDRRAKRHILRIHPPFYELNAIVFEGTGRMNP